MSKDLNEEFKGWMALRNENSSSKEPRIDFQIQVLSSGSWPFTQGVEFALPSEVSRSYFLIYFGASCVSLTLFLIIPVFIFVAGGQREQI